MEYEYQDPNLDDWFAEFVEVFNSVNEFSNHINDIESFIGVADPTSVVNNVFDREYMGEQYTLLQSNLNSVLQLGLATDTTVIDAGNMYKGKINVIIMKFYPGVLVSFNRIFEIIEPNIHIWNAFKFVPTPKRMIRRILHDDVLYDVFKYY